MKELRNYLYHLRSYSKIYCKIINIIINYFNENYFKEDNINNK